MKKELKALIERARAAGWKVELSGGNHWRFTPPHGGRPYYMGTTPSDPRGLLNFRAQLRRGGLQLH